VSTTSATPANCCVSDRTAIAGETGRALAAALTPQEIQKITDAGGWQQSPTGFQFEFHMMHEAGWPCYLREPNGPKRGLPKINLLDYNGQMLQQNVVRNQQNKVEFERVIDKNVAAFQKMARRYYEGVEVAPRTGTPGWYVSFTCSKGGRQNPVFVRLPERGQANDAVFWDNMKRTADRPVCNQHRNSHCMVGTAVNLNAQKALGITKRFDDGQIVA
jgi:hypothetical protein